MMWSGHLMKSELWCSRNPHLLRAQICQHNSRTPHQRLSCRPACLHNLATTSLLTNLPPSSWQSTSHSRYHTSSCFRLPSTTAMCNGCSVDQMESAGASCTTASPSPEVEGTNALGGHGPVADNQSPCHRLGMMQVGLLSQVAKCPGTPGLLPVRSMSDHQELDRKS